MSRLDDITLDDIYAFLENPDAIQSEDLKEYMVLLDKVHTMGYKIKEFGSKKSIIQHLIEFEGLSRYSAEKIYRDSNEYFYTDHELSKQAQRNKLADKLETLINLAIIKSKTTQDFERVSKMIKVLSDILQLAEPDPVEMPDGTYDKPFKVYTFDAKMLQLDTEADREAMSKFIQNLPALTEKQRNQIRQEALLQPVKLFPNDHENARKQE